ncbi:MAG: DJ-1/PfpI family protein [bacterium]
MEVEKKVCMIVASRDFRDEEFTEPKKIFEAAKIKVVVASSRLSPSKGYFGAIANPEILVENVKADEFDAIVFIGGSGAQEYFNNLSALKVAKDAFEKGKIVAAICIAPSILANAGVLSGKRATSFSSEKGNLIKKGSIFTGVDVEVDGKIVTAEGPSAAEKFAKTILSLLSK